MKWFEIMVSRIQGGIMTLERAMQSNPYNKNVGTIGAYIRYLRYNVDGWYDRKSKDIREEIEARIKNEH